MSTASLITLGDEFAQSAQPTQTTSSASMARRSRRSQRRVMEALVAQAIEKKARVQVTAAAAEVMARAAGTGAVDGVDVDGGAANGTGAASISGAGASTGAGAGARKNPRSALARPSLSSPAHAPATAPHDMQALGRLKAGAMNQTEAAYARHLLHRQAAGEIVWHRFEGLTLKLASRATYTPDFVVMRADGQIELHEVKGAKAIFRDDARAKTRIAAGEFPFRVLVVYPRDRAFSGWDIEEF